MKRRRTLGRKSATVAKSRWAAYATAGAASGLGCAASVEASIMYSGPINHTFAAAPRASSFALFPLDQPGHSLGGIHSRTDKGVHGAAEFLLFHVATGSVAGFLEGRFGLRKYASKLSSGQNISARPFLTGYGFLAIPLQEESVGVNAEWQEPGTGFVGFHFNVGDGVQYGWARIHVNGQPGNVFTLIDYAFADPGERIKAGQTTTATVPESGGSLGLLAIGCAGLLAWRAASGGEAVRRAQRCGDYGDGPI